MAYDHLFEPIDLGPLTVKNRIVRSAHGTALGGERLIAYHEARAAGGVGLSTLEATGVHPDAPSLLPLHSDEVIGFYRQLSGRMRPHGMAVLQQIYHPGSATRPKKSAFQVSASAIPNPMVGGIPMAMTRSEIAEMVDAFAAAARRCRAGGLDGIDLHASSGYLIEQFLSPATNVRDDDYGGSLENRMRFLMEILVAIRAEVGDEFCVGIRLPNEEYIPGGLTPAGQCRDRPHRRAVGRLRVAAHGVLLALPQAVVTDGRPARSRDARQRGHHPGRGETDDRGRADHDPRPRRPSRRLRGRRPGLDGARTDRRSRSW